MNVSKKASADYKNSTEPRGEITSGDDYVDGRTGRSGLLGNDRKEDGKTYAPSTPTTLCRGLSGLRPWTEPWRTRSTLGSNQRVIDEGHLRWCGSTQK